MYDSILVATDGSETGSVAVEHAIELADQFGATLYGITVLESRTEYDNAIVDPAETKRRRIDRAESVLADLESTAVDVGLSVETTVESGVPHEKILEAAGEYGVDAIVVGARGRSSFKRALLGGTVDGVVRLTDRPVVVVAEDEHEPESTGD
ncbi:universal stress protein [Natronobacterium gregoryi]|uniref:Universal stress protein n=2 Tax=Natronobacterium gregoryi TaxID=44930 RepID=L0AFF1_NATGS|nr:universal stress protein [Natronobacterium gregoryi]AFZ71785.1 universal stress protein UspA-like protein [Natronobacterium gregoryi SP2]ELY72830.1 UspA domain-containing protein [Natronobacterium gregoryi SP2]PLK21035.1 universal stress protein [Natronobacterium gregoryi SP2]SFI87864.1 Nucleotide-binding universal stress protein, UspA family [Natronobacterium gregoryi]